MPKRTFDGDTVSATESRSMLPPPPAKKQATSATGPSALRSPADISAKPTSTPLPPPPGLDKKPPPPPPMGAPPLRYQPGSSTLVPATAAPRAEPLRPTAAGTSAAQSRTTDFAKPSTTAAESKGDKEDKPDKRANFELLTNLPTAYHVDQAILSEDSRVVVIRFGKKNAVECLVQDSVLFRVQGKVESYAAVYSCNIDEVPDFNAMYELYDPMAVMFFYRNKHIMVDFGTGNNNKMNFVLDNKDELIAIIEEVFRGASKGRGLVVSPKDYSTRYRY